jgi:hypothetical protein
MKILNRLPLILLCLSLITATALAGNYDKGNHSKQTSIPSSFVMHIDYEVDHDDFFEPVAVATQSSHFFAQQDLLDFASNLHCKTYKPHQPRAPPSLI